MNQRAELPARDGRGRRRGDQRDDPREIESDGLDDGAEPQGTARRIGWVGLGAGATRWAREEAARQSPDYERA
jgi:hypothetical protein